MAKTDIATVKSKFQTNDIPTQSDFEDLVDSSHNDMLYREVTGPIEEAAAFAAGVKIVVRLDLL